MSKQVFSQWKWRANRLSQGLTECYCDMTAFPARLHGKAKAEMIPALGDVLEREGCFVDADDVNRRFDLEGNKEPTDHD